MTAVAAEALVPMPSNDVAAAPPVAVAPISYEGLSVAPFSAEVQAALGAPLSDDEIFVRPDDGILYISGEAVRQRLQRAFGIGGWGIRTVSIIVDKEAVNKKNESQPKVFFTGQLWCLGRFVAEATGDGDWITSNPKSDYGTAVEGAKTNCISRCCKDIGMWSELRDKEFQAKTRDRLCTKTISDGWVKRPKQSVRTEPAKPATPKATESAIDVKVSSTASTTPTPVAPELNPNVPKARIGGVGSMPRNIEHTDKGKELREQYAATVGGPVPLPDPGDSEKVHKSDRPATVKDLQRTLERMLPEQDLARHGEPGFLIVTDDKTGAETIEPQRTLDQNAKIHALRSEIGFDKADGEKDYRHALRIYYHVSTSALLTVVQAGNLIERLEKTKLRIERALSGS